MTAQTWKTWNAAKPRPVPQAVSFRPAYTPHPVEDGQMRTLRSSPPVTTPVTGGPLPDAAPDASGPTSTPVTTGPITPRPAAPKPSVTTKTFKAGSYKGKDGRFYYIGTNKPLTRADLVRAQSGLGIGTHKGADGKFRWNGSGALVDPATLAKLRGKPAGGKPGKKPGAGRPVNPANTLAGQVDSAINGMVRPWSGAYDTVGNLANDLNDYGDRVGTGLQAQLAALKGRGSTNSAEMLNAAADASNATTANLEKQRQFLESVIGPNAGALAHDGVASGAASNAANVQAGQAGIAGEVALRGASQSANDNQMRQAAAMGNTEWQRQSQMPFSTMQSQIANQMAAIQAQKPALQRQWSSEDRDFNLHRDAQAQAMKEFAEQVRQFNISRNDQVHQAAAANALGNAQLGASVAGKPDPDSKTGRYGWNIPAMHDKMIDNIRAGVMGTTVQGPNGKPVPNPDHNLGSSFNALRGEGLSNAQAALVSSQWLAPQLRAMSPKAAYDLMRNTWRIGDTTSKAIFTQFFPKYNGKDSWSQRLVTSGGGFYQPNTTNDTGNIGTSIVNAGNNVWNNLTGLIGF